MEKLEGTVLLDFLRDKKKEKNYSMLLTVAIHVLSALSHLHSHNMGTWKKKLAKKKKIIWIFFLVHGKVSAESVMLNESIVKAKLFNFGNFKKKNSSDYS